jgi:hypothetical protein
VRGRPSPRGRVPADTPAACSPRNRPCGTGALIGYARVNTSGQLLDRQQHALAEASCLRVFAGKLSGKNCELAACLDYLRAALVRTVSFGPVIVGPIGAVIATARRHSQMRA